MVLASFFAENYIYFIVIIAISLLGFLLGSFGSIVVLRKEALVSDGVSHATLPGIVLAFIIFQKRSLPLLILGAIVSSLIMMFLFRIIRRFTKVKKDALLAILLAGFFGLGQILLSVLKQSPLSGKAGIDTFMFGQLADVNATNIYITIGVLIFVFIFLLVFWKEIKLATFDEEYFKSLGFSPRLIDIMITFLIVISIVIGLEMVGIVLIVALLILPSFVGRYLTNKYYLNFIISGATGLISGVLGTVLTMIVTDIPPGPSVVIFLSFFAIMTLLFAPKKGFIVKKINCTRHRYLLKKYHYLIHIQNGGEPYEPTDKEKELLLKRDYIKKENGFFILTDKGIKKAKDIFNGIKIWQN